MQNWVLPIEWWAVAGAVTGPFGQGVAWSIGQRRLNLPVQVESWRPAARHWLVRRGLWKYTETTESRVSPAGRRKPRELECQEALRHELQDKVRTHQ